MPETSWAGLLAGWQSLTSVWSEAMGRACLIGTLALFSAFLLTRLLRRAQAGVRCWIWRLAFLKLTLVFLYLPTIPLSVLPEKPTSDAGNFTAQTGARAVETNPQNIQMPARGSKFGADPKAEQTSLVSHGNTDFLGILMSVLPGLWSIGVLFGLVRIGRQYREARALVRSACPITDPTIRAELIEVSRVLGLQRSPDLCVNDLTEVPFLFGLRRPVVILPSTVVTDFSPEDRRMMLAHELAHVKRYDLAWSFLAGLAQVLFFFHPLVWWATRELRMVQEVCCDEQAIQSTAVSAHAYGEVLVRVAVKPAMPSQDGQMTVAMAESFHTIPRRLEEMQAFRLRAGWRRWSPAMVAVVGGVALLPWQLEAQKGAHPQKSQGDPKPGNSPHATVLRTIEAGNYTLQIADLHNNQAPNTNVSGGSVTPKPEGADRRGSASYRAFELNITGKSKEDVMVLEGVEILGSQDERGRTVPMLGMTGKSIPLLLPLGPEGPIRGMFSPQMEQGTKSLKTLQGVLLVIKGTVHTLEFDAVDIRPGASKEVGRVRVTLESVTETERGYEISVTCKSPLLAPPRNTQEYMNQMLAGSRGFEAKLVGTDGNDYKRTGSRGGFQGAMYPQVYGENARMDIPNNYRYQQHLTFGPLRQGVRQKNLVFRVVERQGGLRRIPFTFTDIPLDGKPRGTVGE
jgi:beta-lactamase regulating signal transducer with metallopeptidase domain